MGCWALGVPASASRDVPLADNNSRLQFMEHCHSQPISAHTIPALHTHLTLCMPSCLLSMQELLGDSFRRQMCMDGQFGAISFICTKVSGLLSCTAHNTACPAWFSAKLAHCASTALLLTHASLTSTAAGGQHHVSGSLCFLRRARGSLRVDTSCLGLLRWRPVSRCFVCERGTGWHWVALRGSSPGHLLYLLQAAGGN